MTQSPNIEKIYPSIISDLMNYIETIKSRDKNSALIDIIADYSIKNDIDVEVVGDAIKNDVYFKSFIEKDCKHHKLLIAEENEKEMDTW